MATNHRLLQSIGSLSLSPKQEGFAQLVARGETLSDAYRATYRAGGMAKTINEAASKLARNGKVRARIEALLKQVEASMHRDAVAIRRHVFGGLMKESRNEEAKPSERIAALIALGKIDVVSMFREVHTALVPDERRPEEVELELRSKLRELFSRPVHSLREGPRPKEERSEAPLGAEASTEMNAAHRTARA